jgi:ABC-type nitrate/sulfonate/bicarbonate transport system substrate-binding protein
MSTNKNFVADVPAQFSFPLPSRERVRVRGPLSSPLRQAQCGEPSRTTVKGEEAFRIAIARVLTSLLVGVVLITCGPVHAQTREKVRVALGSISVNTSVIPVGHQYGMFAKYGVDLEPIYMGGGMNSLAAVTSNTVQFLSAGSTATISAHLGGIDIVMLTVQSNKLDYSVFAAPEIKSPQDLKGKIVTGTRPGASADSALRLYLRRAGLVPDKDVIFISVGDSQQGRMNALHRGSVSATVLSPPYSGMAKQFGLRELADLRKSDIEYAGSSIAGMGSYIKSQPQLVENFLKGYIESLYFFRTQKEKTLAGVMKFLKMNDRSRAEEGYNYYVDMMPVMPYASAAGVRAVLQFLVAGQPKAATASPEEFYDNSFLKRIDDGGFTKSFGSKR